MEWGNQWGKPHPVGNLNRLRNGEGVDTTLDHLSALLAVSIGAHTVRVMDTNVNPGIAGDLGPCCSVAGCEARAVICLSCMNMLRWPGVLHHWAGVPRICSVQTCRLCQCPEYEPFLCGRHASAWLADAFA